MLSLYIPEYKDLWFRQQMLNDEETMSYNHAWGGTVSFDEERWKDWHEYWIIDHEDKRYYRYLKDEKDQFIGEIAYHYDEELDGYIADVIIYSKHRGKGYGSIGLDLLCQVAKQNGIEELYDDIAIDNPAIEMFKRHGFIEVGRTDEKIILKKNL